MNDVAGMEADVRLDTAPSLSVDEARQEIKFTARSTALDTICQLIRIGPGGFSTHHPDRRINNIYFDSFDYRAHAENLSGVSNRTKLRYRWYGEEIKPQAGTLELKCKRNHLGWKRHFPVPAAPYHDNASWRDVVRSIRNQVPPEAKIWLDAAPLPVLLNRYRRRYFVSADGRIRVTVDSDQIVYDQRRGAAPNLTRTANHPDILVIEYKFHESDQPLASRLLREMPLRRSRHSKYVVGMLAINNY